ncbi:hypothetical protein ACFQX6_47260 [Streptosporangium lutulentum]
MVRKPASSTAARAKLARMIGEVQPDSGPWMSAKASRVTPAVTVTAPGRSKLRPRCRMPSAGMRVKASSAAPPASGTLT